MSEEESSFENSEQRHMESLLGVCESHLSCASLGRIRENYHCIASAHSVEIHRWDVGFLYPPVTPPHQGTVGFTFLMTILELLEYFFPVPLNLLPPSTETWLEHKGLVGQKEGIEEQKADDFVKGNNWK